MVGDEQVAAAPAKRVKHPPRLVQKRTCRVLPLQRVTIAIIGPRGERITTLEQWREYAPPARGDLHWKDGRGAKELETSLDALGKGRQHDLIACEALCGLVFTARS